MTDTSRSAFEVEMEITGRNTRRSDAGDGYFSYETDVRWGTWQAAWQASRQQALSEAITACETRTDRIDAIKELLK